MRCAHLRFAVVMSCQSSLRRCNREPASLFRHFPTQVYQDNVWASDKTFTSFRKIALDDFQHLKPILFSLHSTSKGYLGECGHRGGYLNMLNCPAALLTQLSKLMSISLCSNTAGQVLPPLCMLNATAQFTIGSPVPLVCSITSDLCCI